MSNRLSKLYICFFAMLCSVSFSCTAFAMSPHGMSPQEQWVFAMQLKQAQAVITDEESKKLLGLVLQNPRLKEDEAVSTKLEVILRRADFVASLLELQEKITDKETAALVQKWLSNQLLLDDPAVQKQAKQIGERIQIAGMLKAALTWIVDKETQDLILHWLEHQEMLDFPDVRKKIESISGRVELIQRIFDISDFVKDKETRALFKEWLDSGAALDDPAIQKKAAKKLNTICRRVLCIQKLKASLDKITRPGDKERTENWLQNPTLLDDSKERSKANEVVLWVFKGTYLKRLSITQTTKTASTWIYALYRKMMFLRSLDNGFERGWGRYLVDLAASGAYFCGNLYEMYLRMCIHADPNEQEKQEIAGQMAFLSNILDLSPSMMAWAEHLRTLWPQFKQMLSSGQLASRLKSWKFVANEVRSDDFDNYLRKRCPNRVKYLAEPFICGDLKGESAEAKKTKKACYDFISLNAKYGSEKLKKKRNSLWFTERPSLHEEFCKEHPDFSTSSDLGRKAQYIGNKLNDPDFREKALLKRRQQSIQGEDGRRGCPGEELDFFDAFDSQLNYMIERKVSKLLTKAGVPKLLRTIFWKNGIVRFTRKMAVFKAFPTALYWLLWKQSSGWVAWKEVVKSVNRAIYLDLSMGVFDLFNGNKDQYGHGSFDRLKEKTCGLISPNMISFLLKNTVSFGTVAASNQISDKIFGSDQGKFITNQDFFPGYPEIESENFAQKRNTWFTRQAIAHTGKNVFSHILSRAIRKIRPACATWINEKCGKFLDFLARRGVIDQNLRAMIGQFSSQLMTLPNLAVLIFSSELNLSDFDRREIVLETARTGDSGIYLDYLLAASIGKAFAGELAEFATDQLKEHASGVFA